MGLRERQSSCTKPCGPLDGTNLATRLLAFPAPSHTVAGHSTAPTFLRGTNNDSKSMDESVLLPGGRTPALGILPHAELLTRGL